MYRQSINPKDSSEIMGAYSHWLKIDIGNAEMIFITWQIAIDKNGNAIASNDIEKQTEIVFENIQTILNEVKSSLDDLVKVVIYVTNINDFYKISPIRNKYLINSKPVSTLIEINKTVKEGCNIEIDAIAIKQK